ncbi:hypothetical protein [Pusillimonas minor]|uniref:Polysaccharide biosynthesis protein n=1 Tax=Pusillimonas minor TaxID=2697024 RepID=A0A842HTL2_9BURK|nr:hypothetical protein [Pusillimonas minor]MBC2770561.1 hypothetical protein [Pusillimonas minor]
MATNLAGKGAAAFAQIYSIFVFTNIHSAREASLLFVLLGYAIWIQVFEFGFSQALQNRRNTRDITSSDAYLFAFAHYLLVMLVAIGIYLFSGPTDLLFPGATGHAELAAFSLGIALMLLATNNLLVQRLMLVQGLGHVANLLLFLQAVLSISGLYIYSSYWEPKLSRSILVYLLPPLIVYFPVLISCSVRALPSFRFIKPKIKLMLKDSFLYWGLGVLSSIFLGADYIFVAHFLPAEEAVAYHFSVRFFFISYVAYFAYIQHQAKFITRASLTGRNEIKRAVFESILIGLISVLLVAISVFSLDYYGIFHYVTNQVVLVNTIFFAATFYFSIRVFRDIGLVVLLNMGMKIALYKLYAFEVFFGIPMLYLLTKELSGLGIFIAMGLTVLISTVGIYYSLHLLLNKKFSADTSALVE